MEAYFARQPILDLNNDTYGYELLYRNQSGVNAYTSENGDISTADIINNTFFGQRLEEILGNKKAFINFTGNLIKRGIPKMISNEHLVVEILESVIVDEELLENCRELKALGYIIALDDFVYSVEKRELFKIADIIKLDFRTPKELIEQTASMCYPLRKTMLAEKVETQFEMKYARKLGCSYMQGYYFARPMLMSQRINTPMARTFLQLLALIYTPSTEIDEIANVVSTDVVLSLRLLKLINNMCDFTGNKISSIHQALVMLGFDKLKEWIYLVGLQRLERNPPDELIKLALFRAKFFEQLSKIVPAAYIHTKELYLMGLMTIVVDTTDEANIDSVLKELPISDNIRKGLLKQGGLFSDIFDLVLAYERADWEKVDDFTIKYLVDNHQLATEYIYCLKFMQQLFCFK